MTISHLAQVSEWSQYIKDEYNLQPYVDRTVTEEYKEKEMRKIRGRRRAESQSTNVPERKPAPPVRTILLSTPSTLLMLPFTASSTQSLGRRSEKRCSSTRAQFPKRNLHPDAGYSQELPRGVEVVTSIHAEEVGVGVSFGADEETETEIRDSQAWVVFACLQ